MAETASRRTRRERGEAGGESEPRKKKRKRREKARKEPMVIESKNLEDDDPGDEFDESSRDTLEVLGSDLVTRIVEFLDARSVARLLVVSRGWHDVASSDRLWAPKVREFGSVELGLGFFFKFVMFLVAGIEILDVFTFCLCLLTEILDVWASGLRILFWLS